MAPTDLLGAQVEKHLDRYAGLDRDELLGAVLAHVRAWVAEDDGVMPPATRVVGMELSFVLLGALLELLLPEDEVTRARVENAARTEQGKTAALLLVAVLDAIEVRA